MRDVDPGIRKVVLSAVLEPNTTQGDDRKVMGPTHPRVLTISHREQIVKDGLGDREQSVRAAASSLIGNWIDCMNIPSAEASDLDVKQEDLGVEAGVLSLLRLFDLGQDTVAADALLSVFTTRSDIFGKIDLNGE
jgi:condensin complex subunit 3